MVAGGTEATPAAARNPEGATQSITVVQDTEPDGPTDFSYANCPEGSTACEEFALDDDDDPTLAASHTLDLPSASYSLRQLDDAFGLRAVTCTAPVSFNSLTRRIFFNLPAGTHITCTFQNAPWPAPPTGVQGVAAGMAHSCVRAAGQVRCWGENLRGGLGDGTRIDRFRPVVVLDEAGQVPLQGVRAVTAGDRRTCALLRDGEARCWGDNHDGAIGDGTTASRELPTAVSGAGGSGHLGGVTQIATGHHHTCAVLRNGQARCWGANGAGQAGDGTITSSRLHPRTVLNGAGTGPLTGVVQIAAGAHHTCARMLSGRVRCWGENENGQVGDGSTADRMLPTLVVDESGTRPLEGVVRIVAGARHSCALLETGQVRCWGFNAGGALGAGVPEPQRRVPVVVSNTTGRQPLTRVVDLAAGLLSTCARLTNAQLRCWGYNRDGNLGDGTRVNRSRPVVVLDPSGTRALSGALQIVVGGYHGCARLGQDQVACWGRNETGQVGDGTNHARYLPVFVGWRPPTPDLGSAGSSR